MSNFKADLKEAKTLNDIFTTVNKHYDTTKPLGVIVKSVIILNIDKLINTSGVKPK